MARTRQAAVVSDDEIERQAIRGYYQRLLDGGTPLPERAPVDIVGPVWSRQDGRWMLPERTIALDAMVWASQWLRGPDGGPWRFTAEQARFLAWYYAVDEAGVFCTPTVVLQRCKGWGKDPLAAVVALIALCGPSVPATNDGGDTWHGRPETDPWIRLLAVSQEQTRTTMGNMPALLPQETPCTSAPAACRTGTALPASSSRSRRTPQPQKVRGPLSPYAPKRRTGRRPTTASP